MRVSVPSTLLCVFSVLAWSQSASAQEPTETNDNESLGIPDSTVYGGEPSATCAWPTTVALGGCTGTLVHPRVVIYAAHCGAGINAVAFGERQNSPAFTVGTSYCRTNPAYNGGASGRDQAFCVLSQEVNMPIVPPLMGCEVDQLVPGKATTIVGFGNTDTNQFGVKHEVVAPLNSIQNDEAFIGGNGLDSCQGDSGGPVYVQLDDGSWRVFGITSYGGACGTGGYYSMMHIAMPWIEGELESEGIDITPCHNSDGSWDPNPECFGFPLDPGIGQGSWSTECESGGLSAYSATCGPPFNTEPDDIPPVVTITTPADGTMFDSMGAETVDVPVAVTATDEGWGMSKVTLFIDGNEIATDTSMPYEWNTTSFPTGIWEITAVGEDYAGNTSEDTVTIGVNMEPPPPEPEDTGDGDEGDGEDSSGTGDDASDSGEVGTGDGGDESDQDGEPVGCACDAGDSPNGAAWGAFALLGLVSFRRRRR